MTRDRSGARSVASEDCAPLSPPFSIPDEGPTARCQTPPFHTRSGARLQPRPAPLCHGARGQKALGPSFLLPLLGRWPHGPSRPAGAFRVQTLPTGGLVERSEQKVTWAAGVQPSLCSLRFRGARGVRTSATDDHNYISFY